MIEFGVAEVPSMPLEIVRGARLQLLPRGVDGLDRRLLDTHDVIVHARWAARHDALVVAVAPGRAQHAEGGEDGGEGKRDDILEFQSIDDVGKPERSATAVHHQDVFVDVVAASAQHVDREFFHVVAHQQVGAFREFVDLGVEMPGHRLERLDRGIQVQWHVAAEKIVRVEVAEQDVTVRDGRYIPIEAASDIGAGASRPNRQLTRQGMDAEFRAHAGADRLAVNHRDAGAKTEQGRFADDWDDAVANDADVETGAADVTANDVARFHDLAHVVTAQYASHGTRDVGFVEALGADRNRPAVREKRGYFLVESMGARFRLDPLEMGPRTLTRIGLRDHTRQTGVFLVRGGDFGRKNDRDLFVDLSDEFAGESFMHWVHV